MFVQLISEKKDLLFICTKVCTKGNKNKFRENEFPKNQIVSFKFASSRFSYLETDEQLVKSFLRAARSGDISKVDRILRDGMPVDVSGWSGQTALHHATKENLADVIKRLLHEGADVNRQDRDKNTPFHLATLYNYTEVARLLMNNGADINIKNKRNEIPLDVARKGSKVERLLLQLQQKAP